MRAPGFRGDASDTVLQGGRGAEIEVPDTSLPGSRCQTPRYRHLVTELEVPNTSLNAGTGVGDGACRYQVGAPATPAPVQAARAALRGATDGGDATTRAVTGMGPGSAASRMASAVSVRN